MAKSYEILQMLIPDGGYVTRGNEFENIEFITCEPITKKQFENGFAQFDVWKTKQESNKASAKLQLLNKLGITEDEAKLLLS